MAEVRTIAFAPLLALTVAAFWLAPAHSRCQEGDALTLLDFNDFHGQLEAEADAGGGRPLGGIARFAAAASQIRAERPARPTLLLFAGDFLQGTLISSLFQGAPDVVLVGRLGVDAATVGNHEFDYGQDVLRRLAQRADFPLLGANMRANERPLPVESSVLLTPSGGPKIAVIGLTTRELATATHPRSLAGIEVQDPVEIAARLAPGLLAQSDMVVSSPWVAR